MDREEVFMKGILVVLLGVALTVICGTFFIYMMIGVAMTAGTGGSGTKALANLIALGVIAFWVLGIRWVFKKKKLEHGERGHRDSLIKKIFMDI